MMKADAIRMVGQRLWRLGACCWRKRAETGIPSYPAYSYEITYIYLSAAAVCQDLKLLKKIINTSGQNPSIIS